MFCKHCGKENYADSKFCSHCGREISAGQANIIGWYRESDDKFFCPECFQKTKDIEKKEFETRTDADLENYVYTCDKCGKELKKNEKSSVRAPNNVESKYTSPGKEKKSNYSALLIVFAVLFVGMVISAVIYFSSRSPNNQTSNNTNVKSEFYTQVTANVRACASTSCAVIGTFSVNTDFNLPYASVSDMPGWVQVSWPVSGGIKYGYMSKSLLGPNEVALENTFGSATQDNQPTKKDLPSIIAEWSPSVALILCAFPNGDVDFGSGFLRQFPDGQIAVVTNKHIVQEEATGFYSSYCSVQIPGDTSYYTENITAIKEGSVGDWGYIAVADGDAYFNKVAEKNLTICQQQAQTGDSVIILGYPDYAGQFTQPTATQGIISGYAAPYYTTNAQIESGNSGGVAVDPNRDCYVGIPTAVQMGNYANLGRILNANIPFQLPY